MTDTLQASLIEKLKKLFAMAQRTTNHDGSSNEAEAVSAMARAQEILAKYNLDIKTIQDSASASKQQEVTGKREETQINRSAMYRWQQQLWAELAKANFCFHWITLVNEVRWNRNCKVKRHVILGSQANVLAVQLMGEYLTETIERLIPYTGKERLSNAGVSWREGCVARLIERIQENAEKMKQADFNVEGSSCTALAVQDLHEKEYAANYDARYGVGAYARMKQRNAEYEARSAEREAERKNREQREAEERARTLAGETPQQRSQREKQEAKEAGKQAAADARWYERYWKKQRREAARRDVAAYSRGFKKGNEINLDTQLNKGSKKEELQ